MQLTWASQVAYACFFFPPLVTKTDTWIRTLISFQEQSKNTLFYYTLLHIICVIFLFTVLIICVPR